MKHRTNAPGGVRGDGRKGVVLSDVKSSDFMHRTNNSNRFPVEDNKIILAPETLSSLLVKCEADAE